jgi:hypothetical protein
MMIDTEKTVALLKAAGVPHERAVVKAEGTAAGWFAAIFGAIWCLAAIAVALILILNHELSLLGLIAIGLFAGLGFAVFGVGMTLVSRDAAPAIAKAGDLLVAIIGKVRSKTP